MRRFTLLLTALAAVGCSPSPSEVAEKLDDRFLAASSVEDREIVATAAESLAQRCPGLEEYTSSLENLTSSVEEAGDYQRSEYGWTRQVVLSFRVNDEPALVLQEHVASGHFCQFEMGGGTNPLIRLYKRPCAALCGLDVAGSNGVFLIPAPELAALD